jgi:methylated-DNA-[protein]-cysteine S-methyltransferase
MTGLENNGEDHVGRRLQAGRERPGSAASVRREAAAAARRLASRIADEGLADIVYGAVDTPFGPMLAATSKRGLVRFAFPEESVESMLERLAARVSPRIVEAPAALEPLRRELDEYFAGRRRTFEVPLDWSLMSPFTKRVLKATAGIPYGGVLSYAEVAGEAGSPRGSRAAGNALGANPIPIVIPCHRVLHSGGRIGGYGGGLDRKRLLLRLEGSLTARMERGTSPASTI